MVFSGAEALAPRWANTRGPGIEKKPLIDDTLLRLIFREKPSAPSQKA
jgi:hypothetical protein